MAQWQLRTGTGVDRLLFFSDAVVAVAITVQALPMIDIAGPEPGQSVLDVLAENSGTITTFISTFFVVAVMWSIHNRTMNDLGSYNSPVFWLNMCWLIGFVFLPWPAAMFAGGDDWGAGDTTPFATDGTGVLYWWTLAYISGMGSLTSSYIGRHPDLLRPEARAYWALLGTTRARYRGIVFFVVFIGAGLATLVYSYWGFLSLLFVFPLDFILKPSRADEARLGALTEQAPPGADGECGSDGQ